jgi:rod shape-determining protein MreD
MGLVLAAVGAAVAALIQASVLPFTVTTGGGLDLLLVLAVVWTMTVSFEGGLVWAFLGGLLIDILLPTRPLGLSAFVLLLAVGAAWTVGRLSPRATYPAAIVVAAIAGGAISILVPLLIGALASGSSNDLLGPLIPSMLVAALGTAILAPIPILILRRIRGDDTERLGW